MRFEVSYVHHERHVNVPNEALNRDIDIVKEVYES